MEDVMKNPDAKVIPPKPTKALGSALDGTDHFGNALFVCGCDEIRHAGKRDDERQLTARVILSLHWCNGSVGRNWSSSSLPAPDLAVSNSRCGLWSCDHHGGSDCNVHTDGLDLAPPVVRRRCRGFHRVWPLQTAAYSAAPVIRAAFYVLSHEEVRGRTAFISLTAYCLVISRP